MICSDPSLEDVLHNCLDFKQPRNRPLSIHRSSIDGTRHVCVFIFFYVGIELCQDNVPDTSAIVNTAPTTKDSGSSGYFRLHTQGLIGSAPGLVCPVSIYCDWVRSQV